jgi:DNA-binding transcriptional LysR family regulator
MGRRGRLDLSLGPALDALLSERNVTRAASRLGVTQSAASHALRKLREHFDDELLVRAPSGFVLTERAERLADAVRRSLEVLEDVDRQRDFDPATTRRSFTLVMADFVALVLLPGLLARITAEAPGIEIVVRPLTADSERALENGSVDLLVASARSTPAGCLRQKILEDGWVCLVRRDHPVVREGLDRARFAALSHVLVAPRGSTQGAVDEALEDLGLSRNIAVRVPQLHLGAFLVARSDLVMTTIAAAGRVVAQHLPLAVLDVPLDLPRMTWVQLWHERNRRDQGHAFLRRAVADASKERALTPASAGDTRRP